VSVELGSGAGFISARPGMSALVLAQFGACASVTTTLVRFESPVLFTVM
jgi:hypothetical protein